MKKTNFLILFDFYDFFKLKKIRITHRQDDRLGDDHEAPERDSQVGLVGVCDEHCGNLVDFGVVGQQHTLVAVDDRLHLADLNSHKSLF